MKKLFTLPFFLLTISVGFTQTATTIYTPNGSVVPDTYFRPELTSAEMAQGNAYVQTNYPNATRLTNSSSTYNCHGYTFHVSEGGNNVWIGYNTTTAEDIYWNDASYMEVCDQTFPVKFLMRLIIIQQLQQIKLIFLSLNGGNYP